LIILYIEHTFLLEANLGIDVRSPEGSLNFYCFAVFFENVKNVQFIPYIPETVLTRMMLARLASCLPFVFRGHGKENNRNHLSFLQYSIFFFFFFAVHPTLLLGVTIYVHVSCQRMGIILYKLTITQSI